MKQISKFARLSVTTVFVAALIITPAFAVEVPDDNESTPLTASNLCTRISTVTSAHDARITERRATLKTNFSNRLTKLETNRASVEEKLATTRQQVVSTFNQKIDELSAMQGLSEEQLTAIDTFKTEMIAAQDARKQAVDTARQTYQSGLRQIISDRQDVIDEATATYDAAVDAAFEKAESNCSSSSALTALRADLSAARNALAAVRETTKPRSDVRSLAETRNSAIREANQTFRATAKKSAETLAKALGITVTITVETDTDSTTTEP